MPYRKQKKADTDLRLTMGGKEILPLVTHPMQKTQITIVSQTDESRLVQYTQDGVLLRCTVPASQVADNLVPDQVLAAGIPYGYPWQDIPLTFDMQKFVNELHQADVWTAEDLLRSPKKLSAALHAALAENLSNVLEIARNEHKGVKHG